MSIHIAAKKSEVSEIVLLPGDPKRAEFIAKEFLTGAKLYSDTRLMKGFTGEYGGRRVSVQTSGMGMPSMGIIAYELIKEYGAKKLIRIGTCGVFQKEIKLGDVLIASGAATDSNYQHSFNLPGNLAATPDARLLTEAIKIADKKGFPYHVGQIVTCDVFYEHDPKWWKKWAEVGVFGVDMEAAALYYNALVYGASALALFTATDQFVTEERVTASERETSIANMVETALEVATS